MKIVQTVNDLLLVRKNYSKANETVALVPTMGALHDGHMALVARAKNLADRVIVSIFVNPKQFGPNEDFAAYPRPAEADAALLRAANVDVLWMPSVAEMYPAGFATNVSVAGLPDRLCGVARPGHFDGVATVVAKLFAQTRPDIAIFGEKDWQQLAIIRRMAADLNLGVRIIGEPTKRAGDGLALSSRNAYLSESERAHAVSFPTALQRAISALEQGADVGATLAQAEADILEGGFQSIDYVEYVDAATLETMRVNDRVGRLIAAARIGKTRLIDNFPVVSRAG